MSDTSMEGRVKEFDSIYQKMSENINKYHKYEPWLTFSLINEYENESITAITIDTYSSKVTIRFADQKTTVCPIMLLDFQYNKNGSGKANSFELRFAFDPTERNDSGGKLLDAMIIDKALTVSSFYRKEGESYKAIETIAKHKCFMRFGYAYNGEMIQSPEYYGQALAANSELRDGMIHYTITGYSSITYITDIKFEVSPIGEYKNGKPDGGRHASKVMAAAIYAAFKSSGDSGCSVEIEGGCDEDLIGSKIKSNLTPEALGILYKGMKIKIKNEVKEEDENDIVIEESSAGLFDFLSSISSSASLKCNEDRKEYDKRATITYTLDELENELIFTIYIKDPTEELTDNSKQLLSNVVYEYPTKENNIVKSFTPDFNFEVVWSKDIFLDDEKIDAKSSFIDKDNVVRSYFDPNITSYLTGSAGKEAKSYATFSDSIQYAYKANLTTIGIPADIPIGTIINIKPIINGQEYHYAGQYMVTKTTDRIDTNGYTTEYDLFKIVPKSSEIEKIFEEKKQEAEDTEQKIKAENESKIANAPIGSRIGYDSNGKVLIYNPGFIRPIPNEVRNTPQFTPTDPKTILQNNTFNRPMVPAAWRDPNIRTTLNLKK